MKIDVLLFLSYQCHDFIGYGTTPSRKIHKQYFVPKKLCSMEPLDLLRPTSNYFFF